MELTCPAGHPTGADQPFCSICGQALQTAASTPSGVAACGGCSAPIGAEAAFCPSCGEARKDAHRSGPATDAAPRPPKTDPVVPAPTAEPTTPAAEGLPVGFDPPARQPAPAGAGATTVVASGRRREVKRPGLLLLAGLLGVGGAIYYQNHSSSGGGSVDTSSVSYQDGYSAGQNCAQNNCGPGDAEQVCMNITELATTNPLPGEDLKVAYRGCVDGLHAAGG